MISIAIIAAIADNGIVGNNDTLPWHLPRDLQRFKTITMGKPIIMGRKTFQSIGKSLPGRTNIVLTTDPSFNAVGCKVAHTPQEALRYARDTHAAEVLVIGGSTVWQEFLPITETLYLTRVHTSPAGDTAFPQFNPDDWIRTEYADIPADEQNAFAMTFETRHRKHH